MRYYLYKMQFLTPIHIGESESARSLETGIMSFCADTLFSAICHTAKSLEGDAAIEKLYRMVKSNQLRFSDAFPFKGETLYIPKPYVTSKVHMQVNIHDRKKMKKLTHIPITKISEFCQSLKGEKVFSAEDIDTEFGIASISTKVSIEGLNEPNPYTVGLFSFFNKCGLYVIVGYEDEKELDYFKKLNNLLALNGIGGKVNSGYGKYKVVDEVYLSEPFDEQSVLLNEMLCISNSKSHISLTASLPRDEELDTAVYNSTFNLIRRGGFVQSEDYSSSPLKKQTQYFFRSGSVFKHTFDGDIFDVSAGGNHPVYRYAKPVFLGVDL